MGDKNKKLILIISFLRHFITVFFTLFLNIYVLKIVDDIGIVIKFNLVGVIFQFIALCIVMKFINSKNVKWIFNSSFIFLIILIGILILAKENICNFIYLFRILYSFTIIAYSAPYELIIMDVKNNKSSNFMANTNILNSIAMIITPIFSGFIIEKFSYMMLFIILSIEAVIIIIIALNITDFAVNNDKLKMKEFYTKIKNKKHFKDIYKCMFYRRISSQGAITDLLPVILFLRVGNEVSVGSYNSIFAIIAIISLQILKYINRKKIKKRFYTTFSIIIFISTLVLVYNTNLEFLIIYYVLMNSLGIVIESESCSAVYSVIDEEGLRQYKREHNIMFNIYMFIGQVISYSLSYILYTYFYNVNILSTIVSILMAFLILSCIYLTRTEKHLELKNK